MSTCINTIVTAIFGAWIGLSGLLEFHLSSKILFEGILAFTIVLGGYLGFQSDWLIRKKAKISLEKRKLQDVELSIISEVKARREEEIEEKSNALVNILDSLGIQHTKINTPGNRFDFHKTCLGWLDQLLHTTLIKKKTQLIDEIEKIKKSFNEEMTHEKIKDLKTKKLHKIICKLSNSSTQPYLTLKPWIRSNFRALIVGLVPTLLGTFGSLFVYLGGAPKFAKELGKEDLLHWLMLPKIEWGGFVLATLITAYFAFSFVYLNRKTFRRDRELFEEENFITREENALVELDDKLLKIKEALSMMEKLLLKNGSGGKSTSYSLKEKPL